MKTILRLFLIFTLITLSVESLSAQAHYRRNFYGDFFAGMTLASMDMEGQNMYKKNKVGFMVGGNANFKIFHNIELQTGFHMIKKGSLQHDKRTYVSAANLWITQTRDFKTTIDANYMQIPLNIGFEVPVTKELFFNMHVGVFGAYGFKGERKAKGFYMNHNDMVEHSLDQATKDTFSPSSMKKWDYGIGGNIGIVYDIYVLRLQYDHGLANVATNVLAGRDEVTKELQKWYTRNYSICLGFRF